MKNFAFALPALLVAAALASAEPKEISSTEGGFKVKMPGPPKESTVDTKVGPLVTYTVEAPDGNAYGLQWVDIKKDPPKDLEEQKKRLEQARDGAVGSVMGKVVADKEIKLEDKHPGRDFTAEVPASKTLLRSRVF